MLKSYAENFPAFHYLPTNSRRGKVSGYAFFLLTLARLPFARLKGRKIIHVHYCSGRSWQRKQIAIKWARIFGYKVVMHCHGGLFIQFCKKHGVEKIGNSLRKADGNIFLTQNLVDYFSKEMRLHNAVAINNIVSRVDATHRNNRSFTATEGRPLNFLFLGTINKNKGILDLINAFAKIQAEEKNIRLKIGGSGPLEKEMFTLIDKLQLSNYIDVLGWVSGEQKDKALLQSDVLILPSYVEGLPISILEAMANGVVVLATPVGGIPDLIEDGVNGLLVEPGDVDGLAKAIELLADDPELCKSLVANSAESVKEYYPEKVFANLEKIYKKILEK